MHTLSEHYITHHNNMKTMNFTETFITFEKWLPRSTQKPYDTIKYITNNVYTYMPLSCNLTKNKWL